jgi:hypothetical protein
VTRIKVDFNSVGRDGMIKGSRRRADGDVHLGDTVGLFDPGEPGMIFDAVVESVSEDGGLLLRVRWERDPKAPQSWAIYSWAHIRHDQVEPGTVLQYPTEVTDWALRTSSPELVRAK